MKLAVTVPPYWFLQKMCTRFGWIWLVKGCREGSKGFEIFDQTKFGATEFQNKVYYLEALQGELTRTIEQMAEVERLGCTLLS